MQAKKYARLMRLYIYTFSFFIFLKIMCPIITPKRQRPEKWIMHKQYWSKKNTDKKMDYNEVLRRELERFRRERDIQVRSWRGLEGRGPEENCPDD